MKKINLEGQKFGRLLVIELLGSSRGGSKLWKCLCDCGNETTASTRHLNRKGKSVVRSCGCLKQDNSGSNVKNWKGFGEISGGWWTQRVMRRERTRVKVAINIDIKYAWKLFLKQNRKCALSGIDLTIGLKNIHNASIDRIDSSKGYIKGNIQWVHKDINKMKNTYTVDYFKHLCKLVTKMDNGSCPIK